MVDQKFRKALDDYLKDIGEEEKGVLLFESPAFDRAICGLSTDGRAVYVYEDMVEDLAEDQKISFEEAEEFVQYNTLRGLAYQNIEIAPVVIGMTAAAINALYGEGPIEETEEESEQ